jgi:hypothetical protein
VLSSTLKVMALLFGVVGGGGGDLGGGGRSEEEAAIPTTAASRAQKKMEERAETHASGPGGPCEPNPLVGCVRQSAGPVSTSLTNSEG